MSLHVLTAGPLTTVQDGGRAGLRAAGVPPSGPLDPWSAAAANLLVGNAAAAALLEITLAGPRLAASEATWIAATGSAGELAIDGRASPWNTALAVPVGATVTIGRLAGGARAYLAVAGGIALAPVLGSRSTYLRGGFGGLAGRRLAAGDELPVGPSPARPPGPRALQRPLFLPRDGELAVRALPGTQYDLFPMATRTAFFASEWRLDTRSDRVGLRLIGPPLTHAGSAEVWPEGLVPGGVQVPGDGQPIVLGVDLPTTGSYAKIATVIAADFGALAHLRPGDRLRFRPCDLATARAAFAERQAELAAAVGAEGENPEDDR